MKRASLVLIAALALAACKSPKPRTELILGVATDLTAPSPLETITMTVTRLPENLLIGGQDFPISGHIDELYELPGTYNVFSDGSADRIQVVLQGKIGNGTVIVERRALLTMIPEHTLFVRLGIVSACQGMLDCPMGDTCIDGRCLPDEIDTTRLPEYTDGMEKTLQCQGATTYVDTSTKLPLPVLPTVDGGAPCGQGTCSEGVCLSAVPGSFAATKGPMTTPRSASIEIGGAPLVLDDGRVLLVGGLGMGATSVLKSAELYDPAAGTFTATGDMTVARTYFGAAKLSKNRALVVGGINDGGAALATAEVYDAATGTFTATKMPMNVARVFPAATTLADGRVLIAGGMMQIQSYSLGVVTYVGALADAELYDPATDTFTKTGNLVESRAFAQMVAVAGDALVLCGEVQGTARTTIERYDVTTGLFTATTMPAGITGCLAGLNVPLADGQLLLTTTPNHAWLFDMAAKTFQIAADHPAATPGGTAALLPGGQDVLFLGNFSAGMGVGKRAYRFHEPSRTFEFIEGEMSVERTNAMGVALPNGDVLVAGGNNDTSAEIFHAAAK
ncbi:MAG TPA: hypothetical protein VHJ20_00755 [Polyangia bacterium]|nr:hypothetical protein [Polyangia bacterium]